MLYSVMLKTDAHPLPRCMGEWTQGKAIQAAAALHDKRAGDVSIVSASGKVYLY